MIVFDLRCDGGHVFEAWFASTAAWEEQRDRALVACPMCGTASVEKAVMAPRIGAKGNAPAMTPEQAKSALKALAAAQAKALEGSRWVGRRFAEEARASHEAGGTPPAIHGQASVAEAKALIEDGVPIAPLPLPVAPPKTVN